MSAEISSRVEAEITLIPGSGGVFEVRRDGELIFSKFDAGRFPNPGEILGLLKADRD